MDGTGQPENNDGSDRRQPNQAPEQLIQYEAIAEPEVITPRSVATPPTGPEGGISWTASEFVAHNKSPLWYGLLVLISLVVVVGIWLLTHDFITTIVIALAAAAFGAVAARQPRELAYRLDGSGLTIDQRQFTYGQFRSFAVMREGAFSSIVFMPMKRFAPLTTIYYDPSDEAKIVDLLSDRLPLEDRQHDLVDRFMWRIRF